MLAPYTNTARADLSTYIESLKYARLIQRGLLPKTRHFKRHIEDHFVLYKPLHFVSGDFYWIGGKEGKTYVAVGDCTGHGVPGAMLSVLAMNILEYSVMNKGVSEPNEILRELDKKFIESFSGIKEEEFNNDWVDIALVCIDKKEGRITFSSANRKLLFVTGAETIVCPGSQFPIGGWQIEENRQFSLKEIPYKKGDAIYLGSDGFQDQFGGDRLKKYTSNRLHNFLAGNSQHEMLKQKQMLEKEFTDWKGFEDQIDDVCILGVRL